MEGFDNKKYVKIQSKKIKERFKLFDKLYIEVGGKLFDDHHAERVLPGFKPDSKINMFLELKKDCEILLCINANDIEKSKVRQDLGITYDRELLRLIDNLRNLGFTVNNVVITLYTNQLGIDKFIKKLELNNIKAYIHTPTLGYPTDVDTIVSESGYGANPYIETTKKIVLVNAPGPCSGKLATCLSQLYHEHKRGINAGYAKFETFPVWDLSLKHPVNIAYEAATADLKDVNMIDPFHLEKYNVIATNYNRDIEVFPVLKDILHKITNSDIYNSPTDMGVNVIGECIKNNNVVIEASKKEIVRRYFNELKDYKLGKKSKDTSERIKLLMNELNIDINYLPIRTKALEYRDLKGMHYASIQINKRKIILGKDNDIFTPISGTIINAIKDLANIPDSIKLIPSNFLESIFKVRPNNINTQDKKLQLSEVLIALSICSVTNPAIEKALNELPKLKGMDLYVTYIISNEEIKTLNNLEINVICEPEFYSDNTFIY